MANLTLGFILLAGLLAAPIRAAAGSSEHLELLEFNEVVNEYGRVAFVGTVQNTHENRSMRHPPRAIVTLTKEGLVILIRTGKCESIPGPGEVCSFSANTKITLEDYDKFFVRLKGSLDDSDSSMLTGELTDPDPSMLTGELTLVERSLNFLRTENEGTLFFGQLFNGTNAILKDITIEFSLFDAEDRFLGTAPEAPYEEYDIGNLCPNETVPFVAVAKDVPFAKVEHWEIEIGYSIEQYELSAVSTITTEATWGQIKQRRGNWE